jgi:hypothetical protein
MRAHRRAGSDPAMTGPPPRPQTTAEQAAGEDLMRNTESFFQHVSEIVRDMKAAGPLRDVVSDELKAVEAVLCSPALVTAYARQDWPYVRASTVQILTDLERIRRIVQGANEAAAAAPAAPRDITIPTDRDEALAILGVNADASEKVVKKIVDAMRQTWHPDLARDDADRRAREARLKQINSAWDLVRSRPHAV